MWAREGADEWARLLAGIGLKPGSSRRGWVCLPSNGSTPVETIQLGVDTWANLWPQWLNPHPDWGATCHFWAVAQRFALHLQERGAFLPVLERQGEHFYARWSPRYLDEDRAAFERLLAGMPEAARALGFDESRPLVQTRQQALEGVLAWMVDESVRRLAKKSTERFPASSEYGKWQTALMNPLAEMRGDKPRLERFAAALADWQRGVELESNFGYRLSFRILEPQSHGKDAWLLFPVLEDLNTPGLSVPLRAVDGLPLRGGAAATESAWISFEFASRLCPLLLSWDPQTGDGLYLPAERILDFLKRYATVLERAGFGVEYPAWWSTGDGFRVDLSGSLSSPADAPAAPQALHEKVRLDWAALLGDQPVTMEELQELARRPGELQQLRGRWLRVDTVSVRDALRFLRNRPSRELSAREALREVFSVNVTNLRTAGWISSLVDRLRDPAQIRDLPAPPGLTGELRAYQRRGYAWLNFLSSFGLGACLADDMGLGKSIQLLALLAGRHESGARLPGHPVLLVCPTSVLGNWQREAAKFFPQLKVYLHHGAQRPRGRDLAALATQHDLVLTSYALVHRDQAPLAEIPWDGIVLDEAQNIKNFDTKQARAVRHLPAEFRVALTGTPVENHVRDLYSLMEFLNPGLLGSARDFQNRFFKPIQQYQDERAMKQLRTLTAPFVLRRLKTDRAVISDLPEKLEFKTYCKLTREQRRLYEDVINGCFVDLEGRSSMQRRGLILATISRLKQVCNHPAQVLKEEGPLAGRSGKLARLTEMLEEVREAGEKALIFSQFAEMGQLLTTHLRSAFGEEVHFLHGGTPRRERDRMVTHFEQPTGPKLFVLSLKAGGTGLNLTAANHVFHYDRWWNPAVENQATDRAFRIGQQRSVQVHKFLCMGTVEERIDTILEMKKGLADRVVESGEVWLTELSNDELRDLFSLSRDAWEDE